jgi:putative addiction module killer protein
MVKLTQSAIDWRKTTGFIIILFAKSYSIGYNPLMYFVHQTPTFAKWLGGLRDMVAKAAIIRRLDNVHHGNLGDIKFVADGIFEMRIFVGPGYRIYYTINNGTVLLLLCGGHKTSQQRDIAQAKKLMTES